MNEDYPETDEYGRRFYWQPDYSRGVYVRVYEPESENESDV